MSVILFFIFILGEDPLNNGDPFKVVVGWDYWSRLTWEQSFLPNSIFQAKKLVLNLARLFSGVA